MASPSSPSLNPIISFNRNIALFFVLLFSLPTMTTAQPLSPPPFKYPSPHVVPTTPLLAFLDRLQETALKTYGDDKGFDPKRYVDLSLKQNLSTVEEGFNKLVKNDVSVKDFEDFVGLYFGDAGDDLVAHVPEDFVVEPDGFLPKVKNMKVRRWALEVHGLWKNLSRKVSDEVWKNPELHTLLPLENPVVVPGSRFREVYYWDSYWVIRGLLASKMYMSAKAIVTNLISLVDDYGFVLNGARAYYTNRSQPPLMSSMVFEIYNRTGDKDFATMALPVLLKEYQFWNSDMHKVVIQDSQGKSHNLSRYYAMWNKPRPESSTIDKKLASKFLTSSEKQQFYRELATAAESGWDFSSRWIRNSSDLTSLAITSILPVDLNAYVLKMELDITFLAKVTGEKSIAESFLKASKARKEAINSIFWNEKKEQWLDYWFDNSTVCEKPQRWQACNQNQNVFASNFVPLWIDLFNSDATLVESVMRSLQRSGLLYPFGIATSLTNSGQQWDFPNGWAPLQHVIVEGLVKSGLDEARSLAEDIAVKWIRTNYVAYKKTDTMHEKQDVEKCGEFGGGGEYTPQTGFGWTNGVVLAFLEEFGWPEDQKIDC